MGVTIPVSERDFLSQVLDLCRLFGWRTYHARPCQSAKGWRTAVQGNGIGWPDVIAVRGNRLVAAELKAGRGKATPEQAEWLARLAEAGAEVFVWKPTDFDDVAKVLR